MFDLLTISYSRSGNTRHIAGLINTALPTMLATAPRVEEIRDLIPHKGLFGFLRSGYESIFRKPCPIGGSIHDPAGRDLLIIGTPNWAGNASSPVQAWINRHQGKIGPYAVFITQASSGGEKVAAQIEGLIGHPPLATLIVSEPDIKSGHDRLMVDDFICRLPHEPR